MARKSLATNQMVYHWLGFNEWEGEVEPEEEVERIFHAIIPTCCVYDISQWKLECTLQFPDGRIVADDSPGEFTQTSSIPHLVFVNGMFC
jgi:hypothetical protein